MEINNLKEWLDKGYIINKHSSDEVVCFSKCKNGCYKFFKSTVNDCKIVEEKYFDTFIEKIKNIMEEK